MPLRKISLWGVVLMAASAVTAAFISSKSRVTANGMIILSNGIQGHLTCTQQVPNAPNCFDTASAGFATASRTTVGSVLTSLTGGVGNTTLGDDW